VVRLVCMDRTIEYRHQLEPPTENLEVSRREVSSYCYRQDDGLLLLLSRRVMCLVGAEFHNVACSQRSVVVGLWGVLRMMLRGDSCAVRLLR